MDDMEETGPFTLNERGQAKVKAAAAALMAACREYGDAEFAGKKTVQDPGLPPEATVAGRNVYSVAVQSLMTVREDTGISVFDMFDGLAQGIGGILGQHPAPAAAGAKVLLFGNIEGYEIRTRRAMNAETKGHG